MCVHDKTYLPRDLQRVSANQRRAHKVGETLRFTCIIYLNQGPGGVKLDHLFTFQKYIEGAQCKNWQINLTESAFLQR